MLAFITYGKHHSPVLIFSLKTQQIQHTTPINSVQRNNFVCLMMKIFETAMWYFYFTTSHTSKIIFWSNRKTSHIFSARWSTIPCLVQKKIILVLIIIITKI